MIQKIKKKIIDVTINYEDGTRDTLPYYALVGSNEEIWFKVMLSPARLADRLKMNNYLAELSGSLVESIEKEK